MFVITLTSYRERIRNVYTIIKNIMDNSSVKPDHIFINLSICNFPNKEKSLPPNLVKYVNFRKNISFNWVMGEDTKTMKKIFPILKYLKDDDIIINTDDDILFPPLLIESRLNDFSNVNYKNAIVGRNKYKIINNNMFICSPTSVFTKNMFNNWDLFVNDTLLKTYHDDALYSYILWLNGYKNIPPSKYILHKDFYPDFNEISSMTKLKKYTNDRLFENIANKEVYKLTGKSVLESFNYFNS